MHNYMQAHKQGSRNVLFIGFIYGYTFYLRETEKGYSRESSMNTVNVHDLPPSPSQSPSQSPSVIHRRLDILVVY